MCVVTLGLHRSVACLLEHMNTCSIIQRAFALPDRSGASFSTVSVCERYLRECLLMRKLKNLSLFCGFPLVCYSFGRRTSMITKQKCMYLLLAFFYIDRYRKGQFNRIILNFTFINLFLRQNL